MYISNKLNHHNSHHSEKQELSWPSDLMTVTPGLIFRTKTKVAADNTLCLGKETYNSRVFCFVKVRKLKSLFLAQKFDSCWHDELLQCTGHKVFSWLAILERVH